jgi:formate-dependent phosphoribosylglycinamide formyltransferase (GAR transformylase)
MATDKKRLLILASKLGYQARGFAEAAQKLGVEVQFGTDRCHQLENPWGDDALPLHFERPLEAAAEIALVLRASPPDGVIALGDRATPAAAYAAQIFGIKWNSPEAVEGCRNKLRQREILRAAGVPVPDFFSFSTAQDLSLVVRRVKFPCVVKPLTLAASQGVIRANNAAEFEQAVARIGTLLTSPEIQILREPTLDRLLVEQYIPGSEVALEGLIEAGRGESGRQRSRAPEEISNLKFEISDEDQRMRRLPQDISNLKFGGSDGMQTAEEISKLKFEISGGKQTTGAAPSRLRVLAIFDKPEPLEGPYFEETIYVTPSRLPVETQRAIEECAARTMRALGLTAGPLHAEFRVNEDGPWVLEAAPRPIGGLCSRALRFGPERITLEELLVRQAVGLGGSELEREKVASGVMMIPVPRSGIFEGVGGLEEAERVASVEEIRITARLRDYIAAWPEGSSYLGFIFARAKSAEEVESALRFAHGKLEFKFSPRLPVEHPVTKRMGG